MDLSIIIVNWRSKDYVRKCLSTVRAICADLDAEIIVVDGASFDGCGEMLAEHFPTVKFIQSQENIGFGRCNNVGFSHATAPNVLFLNPDTEARPAALQLMLRELQRRPDAGILGARLLNTDGSLQTSCVRALPTPLNRALDSNFLRRVLPNSKLWGIGAAFRSTEPIEVEAISGACMLMRSEVFRRVGGFSPQFFMYGEDMDLCAKVRRVGLKNYYVPGAEIVHHGGGSSRTEASEFSTVQMRIAGETYMILNRGRASALMYRLLQIVSAIIRLGMLLPGLFIPERRRRSLDSARKWSFVLKWAFRVSTAEKPNLNTRILRSSVGNVSDGLNHTVP